jgi:hypothetical protein
VRQRISILHCQDSDGNPTGGFTDGTGIQIQWQNGPLGRGLDRQEPTGAFVEDVIEAAIERLTFYQTAADGRFACKENERAIVALTEAKLALTERTLIREARGVEGTHTP